MRPKASSTWRLISARATAPGSLGHASADDLKALADFLADKPYFLGDRPTTLDATTYGFLANVLLVTLDTPHQAAARTHANLCRYVARMTERYFPDG